MAPEILLGMAHGWTLPAASCARSFIAIMVGSVKSYSVTLQLDISKALDRVSWVFLLETLQALGFG